MPLQVVILADESANWKIAGLRQLDRLAHELNALGLLREEIVTASFLWSPELAADARVIPQNARLTHIAFYTVQPESADLLLSSRILLYRRSAAQLTSAINPRPDLARSFEELSAQVRATWSDSDPIGEWEYLESAKQITACEKRFLRASGKSQDGLVSRFINRPISRFVSRFLLTTRMTPSAWTLSIFSLPLAGAIFLARGSYVSVIAGLIFFQLYSILDGCDGEIARAKYLTSPRGQELDTWCDIAGNLLLVLALGYGLARSAEGAPLYFLEGIIVALLIATNELLLHWPRDEVTIPAESGSALYPRHQRMFGSAGLRFLGPRLITWLVQLTKRDVAVLAFLVLGLLDHSAWILHLSGGVAAVSCLLALKSRSR